MFSNNFPCSLCGDNMSLPASPERFLRGTQSRFRLLPQLLLAVAQNILPGIFFLELNVPWISFPYVFLGKYLPFLLCLLQFDIRVSAHSPLTWLFSRS